MIASILCRFERITMKPFFHVFGGKIPLYGTLIVCAYLIGIGIATHNAKKYKMPKEDIIFAATYAAIGLILGAKLLYFISLLPKLIKHFDLLFEYPAEFLQIAFGGYVFYGGLIGVVLGVWIYCARYKVSKLVMINSLTPVIPFVHSIGRIGCFMAGCCYGIEYHGPLSVHFPENELTPSLHLVPRFPIQLLESGLNMTLFVVLMMIGRKKRQDVRILGIYLISYSILRFALEFLRGDIIRGQFLTITTSQWVSILLLPLGIYLILRKERDNNIEKKENCYE